MSPNEKSREQEFYEYLGYVFSKADHVSFPISPSGFSFRRFWKARTTQFQNNNDESPLADSTTVLTTRGL